MSGVFLHPFTALGTSRFDWLVPHDGGTASAGAHELGRMLEEVILAGVGVLHVHLIATCLVFI